MRTDYLKRAKRHFACGVLAVLAGVLFFRTEAYWWCSGIIFVLSIRSIVLAIAYFILHYSVDMQEVNEFIEKYRLKDSPDFDTMERKLRSIANDEFAPSEDREVAEKILQTKIPVGIRIKIRKTDS